MRQFLFYIVGNLICLSSFAQDRQILLIIDTVYNAADSINVRVTWPDIDFDDLQNENRRLTVNKTYPNVMGFIGAITRNSTIELPLDKSGGSIAIKNVYKSQLDTIHLSRLTISTSCFPDSSHLVKFWYRRYPFDSRKELEPLYQEEVFTARKQKRCQSNNPSTEHFVLNGKDATVQIVKAECAPRTLSSGHGYACGRRKLMRRERNGKWVKYFHFEKEVRHLNLYAEIDLRPE